VKPGLMIGVMCSALGMPAAGVWAQGQPQTAAKPGGPVRAEQVQARFQIAAMEAVLERAVQAGAQNLRIRAQQVAPEMLFINGAPRARGFWLDGYGVFFDVDVPAIRPSMWWSVRVLAQNERGRDMALRDVKSVAAGLTDPDDRRKLQNAIQRLEQTIVLPAPPEGDADTPGTRPASTQPFGASPRSPETEAILEDPGLAYTNEVRNALIDAVVEYSAPIPLAPQELLTVAARDQEGTRLQPGDPYDVSTLLLRVRGSDLAAYRAGQIDKGEIRRRVEVKEY
jgi:hypothetical protein